MPLGRSLRRPLEPDAVHDLGGHGQGRRRDGPAGQEPHHVSLLGSGPSLLPMTGAACGMYLTGWGITRLFSDANFPDNRQMRIVVVGAGLAGLAAAWTASADGHDVTVLEARDRVGGRTWSHEIAPGVVVERGGEWIDADQHTIRRFCADLGLPIAPHGVSFHRRMVRGRLPGLDELESTLEAVSKEIPPEDCSVTEAFEAALGERYAEDPAYLRIMTSTAGDPGRASARFHVARAEAAGIDGAGRVVGGNQQISLELAHRLGSVRLGAAVTTIGDDGVGLADGSTVPADRVVVAVPLALLDTLTWASGFPDRWREGLAHVATGAAAKLSLPATRNRARGVQHPQHA
ncbi:MAG TPA: FAD-dependent oxidoreductase, partial [Nocardioides sp.]|nr:FAD-dependent oxidoreductase [Nocardioides sp.]